MLMILAPAVTAKLHVHGGPVIDSHGNYLPVCIYHKYFQHTCNCCYTEVEISVVYT